MLLFLVIILCVLLSSLGRDPVQGKLEQFDVYPDVQATFLCEVH